MDTLSPKQRSYCMSQIKGKNTSPEMALRKQLWRMGYRYRLKSKLPGKPDLVFAKHKVVVFVDGCFWHKCPDHFVQPKKRAIFWQSKIDANVERDHKNSETLESQGWQVIRIWEHEIKSSLEDSIARVVQVLEEQKDSKRLTN
ncbi:very short patch repair endonuclease [Marinobacter sp. R17]|uniref:very short patch repair endonuclease n=1 Tax=Marinobacter sp. R17 TaxID=2484250 RepID=UPI000F4CD956|nr:very short patch repair endonuclease [Marinobacter sp. R17]ROU01352.1 very short patch repair endonuclease [Marinobacter sp. R17]